MYARFYPGMQWSDCAAHWPLAAHSRFVQAAGVRWHVQVMGQGPVVLLLHGTGSGSFSWRGVAPLLAPHFTVVAPDLPGHAFSSRGPSGALSLPGMAQAASALLHQLNLRPHALVGHSAGAAVAAQMALHHRGMDRCQVVGLNPAWLPLSGAAAWLFSPMARLADLNPLSAWILARLAARPGMVDDALARTGSTLDASGRALYRQVLSHTGHVHGVLSMMAAWDIRPLGQALHTLRNPVFLHIGLQDQTVPPAQADQALQRLPQARCVRLPGLGHLAHEEDPPGAAAQLMDWLA